MKKILLRISILFVIFIGALIGFASFLNEEKTDSIEDMEEASLPVLCMDYEGMYINQMHGYRQEMQVNYYRDTLTPMETNRELTVAILPYKNKIKQVNYEVRTANNNQVVENGKITNLREEEDYIKGDLKIQNPILMDQEYTLVFKVQVGEEQINYYTRLIQRAGLNVKRYLEFVTNFYQKCTNKNAGGELMTYLEPDDTVSNSSFTEVNIHSSQRQITWGDLNPTIYRQAIPDIKEINGTTASIALNYMISSSNSNQEQELFYVDEFYRMRLSHSKIMLLDFERSAKELFDGSHSVVMTAGINLGVTSKDVSYVTNQSGDIVAFVQQGELWSYNKSASKLSRIFSFRGGDKEDERNDFNAHDIKIVRVEENGEIDFVLYGYMNRGIHEGKAGIGVYHYYSEKNAVEERIFIPLSKSYEFLKRDLDMLSYVNKQNQLYLYLEEKLYEVDIQNKTYQVIKDGINTDCFVIAKNQSFVAWMEEMEENNSQNVTIMDFESGETRKVSANPGERIKALGFMNNDFVYGLAKENAIVKDPSGNVTFGMYTIRIQNFGGELMKEYTKPDIWIPKVEIKEGLVELTRMVWENNQYIPIASDHIMNKQQQTVTGLEVKSTLTNAKGRQISLVFSSPIRDKDPLVTFSRMVILESKDILNMEIPDQMNKNVYYVYAKGKLDSMWTKVNEAVRVADEKVGVVLNGDQQYIWERGNRPERIRMNLEDIPPEMLTGVIDEQQLKDSLRDSYKVLNFTGCTLEEVLYQVGQENPVVVKISDEETRIIVGYDGYNTWLYDPSIQEVKPYGINDSTELFAKAGNVFVGFIENLPAN